MLLTIKWKVEEEKEGDVGTAVLVENSKIVAPAPTAKTSRNLVALGERNSVVSKENVTVSILISNL